MSSDNANTKPTIETVLERINSLGQELHGEIQRLSGEVQQLNGDFQKLRGEVQQWSGEMVQLREDMDTGFRKIGRKMEALSEAWLEVRGDLRYHDRRIEKLEGEPA